MSNTSTASLARVVYVLHLVGLITGGLTAIVGVIIAHLNAGDEPVQQADPEGAVLEAKVFAQRW